jgi:hypothetical protein
VLLYPKRGPKSELEALRITPNLSWPPAAYRSERISYPPDKSVTGFNVIGRRWDHRVIDLPVFLVGVGSMSLFYGPAYKRQQESRSARSLAILPALTSGGIALDLPLMSRSGLRVSVCSAIRHAVAVRVTRGR